MSCLVLCIDTFSHCGCPFCVCWGLFLDCVLCFSFPHINFFPCDFFQWMILVWLSNPIIAVPVQNPAPVQALWSQLWPHLFSSLWWRCLFCLSCRIMNGVESDSLSIIWVFMDLIVTFFKVAWTLDHFPAPGAQTLGHLCFSCVVSLIPPTTPPPHSLCWGFTYLCFQTLTCLPQLFLAASQTPLRHQYQLLIAVPFCAVCHANWAP